MLEHTLVPLHTYNNIYIEHIDKSILIKTLLVRWTDEGHKMWLHYDNLN